MNKNNVWSYEILQDRKFPSCGSAAFSAVHSKPQSVTKTPKTKQKNGCVDVESVWRKLRAMWRHAAKPRRVKKHKKQKTTKINTGERKLCWRSVSHANACCRCVTWQVASN